MSSSWMVHKLYVRQDASGYAARVVTSTERGIRPRRLGARILKANTSVTVTQYKCELIQGVVAYSLLPSLKAWYVLPFSWRFLKMLDASDSEELAIDWDENKFSD